MELRHLRYFVAVAKHLHFSTAAKELNISQPPLSKQIKQLEDELGVTLFLRTNRDVKLTAAGAYFFESAKNILDMVERDVNTVRKIHCGEIGTLTIGFGGSVVFDLLPKIIKEIKNRYPEIKLNVRQLTTEEQLKSLLNGTIDVGLLVPPIENKKIDLFPIRDEVFVVCLPKNHYLAKSTKPIDIKELANEPIIMTPESSGKGYYNSVLSLCRKGGFYPNITQTAQEQQTLVSLVAAELGIAFVPESTKRIIHENVQYLSLKQQHKKVTAVAWNPDCSPPVVKLFIDLIKTHDNRNQSICCKTK